MVTIFHTVNDHRTAHLTATAMTTHIAKATGIDGQYRILFFSKGINDLSSGTEIIRFTHHYLRLVLYNCQLPMVFHRVKPDQYQMVGRIDHKHRISVDCFQSQLLIQILYKNISRITVPQMRMRLQIRPHRRRIQFPIQFIEIFYLLLNEFCIVEFCEALIILYC